MLSQPPRDANGQVLPHDHAEILNEDRLIRRINPIEHVVPDGNTGRRRISTKAIQPSSEPNGGMSVDHERTICEAQLNPTSFVTTPVYTGSIAFGAGVVRAINVGLRVGYDPIPGENDFHCEVWGPDPRPNRFSKGQQRAILAASAWFVEIQDTSIT
jgi:hypothetical protein